MMTVDIRVNESGPIAVLYIHNLGRACGNIDTYEYERHDIGKGTMHKGNVVHNRTRGAWALVAACIEDWQGVTSERRV